MYEGLAYIQLGKQVSLAGGEVASTTKLRAKADYKDLSEYEFIPEDIGIAGGAGRVVCAKKLGELTIEEIPLTFEQGPYFMNMWHGVAGVQDGAGSGYAYTWPIPYSGAPVPYLYTLEQGDEHQFRVLTGCFANGFKVSGKAEGMVMIQPTVNGQPQGNTTATAALSIPTVETGLFGRAKLYINDVSSTFGTTQVSDAFRDFELEVKEILTPHYDGNGGTDVHYTGVVWNTEYEVTLSYTLKHLANAVTEDGKRVAKTPRAVRIQVDGAALGTAGTYSTKLWRFDICGTYSQPMEFSRDNGIIVTKHVLKNHYDATLASRGTILCVNELSTLP